MSNMAEISQLTEMSVQLPVDWYLDSKILEIKGVVSKNVTDLENNKVVLLESNIRGVGVRCTLMSDSEQNMANISVGEEITVKGVILVGASYDADLELFEDAVLNNCYLIN